MKKTLKLLVITILLVAMIIPDFACGQHWGGRRKPSFWDNWSVNGSVGLSSFFGDLSVYDTEIIDKLINESGPAMGLILSKHFNPKFALSGQLLYGNLQGANAYGLSFESSFIEYNFQGRVDLVNLIWPYSLSKFGWVVYGGVGQFLFNTTKWDTSDGQVETQNHKTDVPEFVYFFGSGFYYKFNHKWGATFDIALRQAQNDYIDYTARNDNFDYYTHLSIGATYYIESFKKGNHYTRGKSTRGKYPGNLPMRRRR